MNSSLLCRHIIRFKRWRLQEEIEARRQARFRRQRRHERAADGEAVHLQVGEAEPVAVGHPTMLFTTHLPAACSESRGGIATAGATTRTFSPALFHGPSLQ